MKLQDAVMRIRLLEAGMLDWNTDVESNRRALAAMLQEMERLAAIEQAVTRLKRDLTETNETLPRELPVSFNQRPIGIVGMAATVERVMARHCQRTGGEFLSATAMFDSEKGTKHALSNYAP